MDLKQFIVETITSVIGAIDDVQRERRDYKFDVYSKEGGSVIEFDVAVVAEEGSNSKETAGLSGGIKVLSLAAADSGMSTEETQSATSSIASHVRFSIATWKQ